MSEDKNIDTIPLELTETFRQKLTAKKIPDFDREFFLIYNL